MPDIAPNIVLCVPGMWQSRLEIVDTVARKSDGLEVDGDYLRDTSDNAEYLLEINGYDPALARAFSIAARRSMTPDELDAVKRHIQVVYVSGVGGSTDRARSMMRAGSALLKAGGLGIKVESSGTGHSPGNWLALEAAPELVALYHAYVTLVAGENVYYSCGMHNLGLPDATAPRTLPPGEAAKLMESFLLYTLYEQPELADGHTFSLSAESTLFRLQDSPCTMFPPDDLFHNPYGMWMLH